ncbi:ABC transporter substrate-binding protein [Shewanella sp. UCD-KL12]|uniref:ABC transporter substrate-binding protein n=1 Tax=Shewanella sp. UCD-KL12 TaxID=1917163 RepID=UPI0009711575|nr:ABC transporter substrate-binding protein [Shewanella sp. UCD-KL12]
MRAWLVLSIIIFLSSVTSSVVAATTDVVIQPKQSKDDASYQYYVDLISLVLEQTQVEFGEAQLVESTSTFTQSRGFNALNMQRLDLYWAGTNEFRELEYRAIRIPLMAGLLGVRVPVIKAANYQMFLQIGTSGQLKALTACQGDQWPDSDILEENGYRVERVTKFSLMYSMLKQGRCDYFPRGITEVYAELEAGDKQGLVAFDKILLSYPFPMYIFVDKSNDALALRLESGLSVLVNSGKLSVFMQQHPVTKTLFPLEKYSASKLFQLTNQSLPKSTPLDDELLWLKIKTSRH